MGLVVLATVIGFLSILAVWVKRQALETDTWTETSVELLENEEIRNAVADFLVVELYANVDVEAEIARQLPPQLQRLAGPISGALRQLADRGAREALAQPRVQSLWEEANRAAHSRLLAVIDDESEAVSTTGGVVTLDLTTILNGITQQLGIGADLAAKLPPEAANLEILRSDELEAVQNGVDLLRTLAWFLTALTFALYGLAIWLARDRRREMLRTVGIAFVAMGVLVLFVHALAERGVVGSLADTEAAEPPVEATWSIATSLLVATGQAVVAYGIVIILAAWLAGPTASATSLRRAIAPYFRQPQIAYGGLAFLVVLLFWWDPTEATHRLAPSLLLIALLVLGVEVLRRQVIREFPDRVTAGSPAGVAQGLAARMREARERRTGTAGEPPSGAPEEERIERLERLARLRESGVLTEEEFAAEKQRIL
jgi:Short C-terminal domain